MRIERRTSNLFNLETGSFRKGRSQEIDQHLRVNRKARLFFIGKRRAFLRLDAKFYSFFGFSQARRVKGLVVGSTLGSCYPRLLARRTRCRRARRTFGFGFTVPPALIVEGCSAEFV